MREDVIMLFKVGKLDNYCLWLTRVSVMLPNVVCMLYGWGWKTQILWYNTHNLCLCRCPVVVVVFFDAVEMLLLHLD